MDFLHIPSVYGVIPGGLRSLKCFRMNTPDWVVIDKHRGIFLGLLYMYTPGSGAANYTNFVDLRGVRLIITLGKVVVNRQYSNEWP